MTCFGETSIKLNFAGRDFEEVAVLTNGDLADEMVLVVDLGVGLRDDFALFLVSGEVLDLVGDAAVFRETIRRFDEAEFVYASVGRERVDQTDVRTFRRLDRADTAVVRRMNVTNFEASTFAIETAWPERGETTLVRDLGERVDLVHELRQL